jgi:hypothetical protein
LRIEGIEISVNRVGVLSDLQPFYRISELGLLATKVGGFELLFF